MKKSIEDIAILKSNNLCEQKICILGEFKIYSFLRLLEYKSMKE